MYGRLLSDNDGLLHCMVGYYLTMMGSCLDIMGLSVAAVSMGLPTLPDLLGGSRPVTHVPTDDIQGNTSTPISLSVNGMTLWMTAAVCKVISLACRRPTRLVSYSVMELQNRGRICLAFWLDNLCQLCTCTDTVIMSWMLQKLTKL